MRKGVARKSRAVVIGDEGGLRRGRLDQRRLNVRLDDLRCDGTMRADMPDSSAASAITARTRTLCQSVSCAMLAKLASGGQNEDARRGLDVYGHCRGR